jgi:hypothetical protein
MVTNNSNNARIVASGVYSWVRLKAVKITQKNYRQQAEVIQNHENENVRYIGQGEARHRKYKRRSCVRPFKCQNCRGSMSYL